MTKTPSLLVFGPSLNKAHFAYGENNKGRMEYTLISLVLEVLVEVMMVITTVVDKNNITSTKTNDRNKRT